MRLFKAAAVPKCKFARVEAGVAAAVLAALSLSILFVPPDLQRRAL